MTATIEYLNAVKAKTGAVSDYALAKELGTSRQAISGYMNGKHEMGNEIALKAAQILEIDPLIIISAIQGSSAKTYNERNYWKALFERLGGVAASLLLGVATLSQPAPVQASQLSHCVDDVYYVKSKRRTKRFKNPLESLVFQLMVA